jgi:hypothetical protein
MMEEPYRLSCQFFCSTRKLVLLIRYFLKILEHVIVKGYREIDDEFSKRTKELG